MTKRAAIFAHFDKNSIIQDYVIYYLEKLTHCTDTIIFVSDCSLTQKETLKIESYTDKIIAKNHGEYDFGSYKRGFQYLDSLNVLNEYDELIFVNDSCFGPLCDFEEIMQIMNKRKCDFWGINKNERHYPHIQSFFIVFRKNIFNSPVFKKFIYDIKKQKNKDDIIVKYEIGLSKLLSEKGYTLSSYLDFAIGESITPEFIFSEKSPSLLKTSAVRNSASIALKILFMYLNKKFNCKYPFELIYDYNKKYKSCKYIKETIKSFRKLLISIHVKERRLYILGQWYSW